MNSIANRCAVVNLLTKNREVEECLNRGLAA
nr:MAG TPA: hypothetical protein [Caudoviricetes sp.]